MGRRGRVSFVPWDRLVGSCRRRGSPNPASVTGQCPPHQRPESICHVVVLPVKPYISGQHSQGQTHLPDILACADINITSAAEGWPFSFPLHWYYCLKEHSRKGILPPSSSGLGAMPGTDGSTVHTMFLAYSTFKWDLRRLHRGQIMRFFYKQHSEAWENGSHVADPNSLDF